MRLVRLKKEAPARVALIAGNRDLNKIRIRSELSLVAMKLPPGYEKESWLKIMKERFNLAEELGGDLLQAEILKKETQAARLQFLLKETFGAPKAFEFKREELAKNLRVEKEKISDEDVVASFWNDLGESGIFREYLGLLQLGVVLDGTLYTHSDVSRGFKKVPRDLLSTDLYHSMPTNLTVREWIDWMNKAYREQIRDWMISADSWRGVGDRPGELLIQYSRGTATDKANNPDSIVFSKNLDESGRPKPLTRRYVQEGIFRFVQGHVPVGDIPFIVRGLEEESECVWGDTSYGDNNPVFIRIHGKELEIEANGNKSKTIYGYKTPIGKYLPNNAVIVARLGEDKWLSFDYGPNFTKVYETIQASEAEMQQRCDWLLRELQERSR